MSDIAKQYGIIPPYMREEWRVMRAHLRLAASHAEAAADASTIEDVALNVGAATISLIDADFLRRQIERKDTTNAEEAEGHADRD